MIKQAVIIGCLVAVGPAQAGKLRPARLAPPEHADTEVTTNVTCDLNLPSLKRYRLALGLVGTPSNNVEVALGNDADHDGTLSLDERALWFKWDCGAWSAGGVGGTFEPVTGGPDTNGVVWAAVEVDVRRHRSNPRWLYSDTWNLMRVTRRGVEAPLERVFLRTETSGTLISIR